MATRKKKVTTPRQYLNTQLSKALAYYFAGNVATAKVHAKALVSKLTEMGLIDRTVIDGRDQVL